MAQPRSPSPFPTTEMRNKQCQEDEQEQQPLGSLPEGPLVEILSRVPYASLCRFKCVSRPWLALCSAPDIRKRSPQTLSGFFYNDMAGFCNLSGRGQPMVDVLLPFLRKSYEIVNPEHCCGGLVLCKCWKSHNSKCSIVVCNPATENWIELPPCLEMEDDVATFLGFDPTVPSRFVVLLMDQFEFREVAIYSSGRWTTVQSGWINESYPIVFLNDTMHLGTLQWTTITVDSELKVWRELDIPGDLVDAKPSIGQSQGRLYAWYASYPTRQLFVWALEDYSSAKWTLKYTVDVMELFGRHGLKYEYDDYHMFAIHPDRNLIFLNDFEKTISNDMDNREVHVISISGDIWDVQPYIPCFAECLSDGH